jgi:hypothetical protein
MYQPNNGSHINALEDVGRIVDHGVEREGFPGRLVLAGKDAGALRQLLDTAPFYLGAADDAQQPQTGQGVRAHEGVQEAPRQDQCRQRRDHLHDDVHIEQQVEDEGADIENGRASHG